MSDFLAKFEGPPRMQAWLSPEDPNDDLADPFAERPSGWRLVIELPDVEGDEGIVRSTWELHLHEVLGHMDIYWPGKPVWCDVATGEVVALELARERNPH